MEVGPVSHLTPMSDVTHNFFKISLPYIILNSLIKNAAEKQSWEIKNNLLGLVIEIVWLEKLCSYEQDPAPIFQDR